MPISFTLDTNCLIDVADDRPSKRFVLALTDAARTNEADVAIVATTASELQEGGDYLLDIQSFKDRIAAFGLSHLVLLKPIGRWNFSFSDHCIRPTVEQVAQENLIFQTLFPNTEPEWSAYAALHGLKLEDFTSIRARRWRNKLCDAQVFWAHNENNRDIFVTNEKKNFHRLLKVAEFSSARIATPSEAAALIY